ncbi:MAG: histidine kinase [Saprospiraceae bacterium]
MLGNVSSYATTGDWWISNQKEVYRFHKKTRNLTNFTADVGNHPINKLYEDREGNIWFATDGNGLYMLNNPDILNFNTRNSSLSSNQIQRIELDSYQNAWLGLSDRHLMQLRGGQLRTVPYHSTKSNTQFYDLVFNRDTLFVIADQVYQIHAGKNSIFYPNQIKSFCIDQQNDIWMGDSDIIFRRNQKRQIDEIFRRNMRCYAIASSGQKTWFGTTKGLYFFDPNLPLHYSQKDTSTHQAEVLPSLEKINTIDTSYYRGTQKKTIFPTTPHPYIDANGNAITADINHIDFTADGTLWLTTSTIGLYYIKDNLIHQFNETHGLSSNICKDLFVDQDDNIWVATTKGLGKISYPSLQYTQYSSHDGLSSDGITSIRCATDSTLYIGTLKGLCITKESQLASPSLAPNIHLHKVSINERDTILAKRYRLTYDQNNIVLNFMSISYKSQLSYLYRLQKNTPWIPTDNTSLRLAELSPGTYHFEVKAQNVNGLQSKKPLSIEIRIAAPWWETLRFKIALFALLGGCIGLFAYLRIQQIKKQEKEKTDINKRFAALELQALQAQMNPHFVFNALGAIQKFILNQEEHEASDYLTRFAQLMRLFLDSSREKYISLSDELNLLQLYLTLEQLRFGDKLNYRILTDPALDVSTIEIPSMLLQPFVENAINHGLRFKAKEGLLTIRMQLKNEGLLACTIEDNGVGRQAAAERKQQTKNAYKSRGTAIVNDRLKVLNFIEAIDIQIKTHDRLDAQNQACGTTVTILIPIEH